MGLRRGLPTKDSIREQRTSGARGLTALRASRSSAGYFCCYVTRGE